MRLIWSPSARMDMVRLHRLLASRNKRAATQMLRSLRAGAIRLLDHPRLGEKVKEVAPREVRRLLIDDYELRYEPRDDAVVVLRIWHTREDR